MVLITVQENEMPNDVRARTTIVVAIISAVRYHRNRCAVRTVCCTDG
jgi:hypothetical protein